ncbi:alcohol dehydrogenase [Aspergillus campestris IBT 28561]|uniref:Alcohol dehydrogenase n=1 Tax=Aspergillus campestris (strain IBT 28561) TaxID=1392248 RepID=A0A2I1D5I4_ASPC2|nr:alcohol dehydrogenase [Aspergillus campestris IBT 28561]PKY05135.1 alcohol dehydrogenase [Aspergillus campestris IBT 28561]
MPIPESYKAFRRTADGSSVEMTEEKLPSDLQPNHVVIRIHAVSLNYRDVAMMHGKYPVQVIDRGIPASDCAAEVITVGSEVKDFNPGDRVAPLFDLKSITGTEDEMEALGGDADGVLRQYAVFDQKVLVHLPKHLSWEEAACINCAGTTAWKALDMPRSSGSALLQGTGGVSMFALLICLAAGIQPIITSSSDEKLETVRALGKPGQVKTINYKTHPNWEEEARRLTNGRGVDVVVDNVGPTAIAQSLSSLARRGVISFVGFLGGFNLDNQPDVLGPVLLKSATLRGITPGSKPEFQALCNFLEEKAVQLKPVMDKTIFNFEDSKAAFDHLYAAKHMGKVVIRV